jgi:hypothetical protein
MDTYIMLRTGDEVTVRFFVLEVEECLKDFIVPIVLLTCFVEYSSFNLESKFEALPTNVMGRRGLTIHCKSYVQLIGDL